MDGLTDIIVRALGVALGIIVAFYIVASIVVPGAERPPVRQDGKSYVATVYSGGEKVHRWRGLTGYRCFDSYTRLYLDDGYLDIVGGPIIFEEEVAHASGRHSIERA